MTTCWDPSPQNRPSMEFVVSQMHELCRFFPGADQVLEYAEYSDVSQSCCVYCRIELH